MSSDDLFYCVCRALRKTESVSGSTTISKLWMADPFGRSRDAVRRLLRLFILWCACLSQEVLLLLFVQDHEIPPGARLPAGGGQPPGAVDQAEAAGGGGAGLQQLRLGPSPRGGG